MDGANGAQLKLARAESDQRGSTRCQSDKRAESQVNAALRAMNKVLLCDIRWMLERGTSKDTGVRLRCLEAAAKAWNVQMGAEIQAMEAV